MEKNMEHEMETGVIWGLFRDPSIQIIPTCGPKVCKYYLHWAIWIRRALKIIQPAARILLLPDPNLKRKSSAVPLLGKAFRLTVWPGQ